MKISALNRFDAIDREQFRTMIECEAFQVLQARITTEHERAVHACVVSEVQLDVARAQGAAAALKTAIALPRQILAEMNTPQK